MLSAGSMARMASVIASEALLPLRLKRAGPRSLTSESGRAGTKRCMNDIVMPVVHVYDVISLSARCAKAG